MTHSQLLFEQLLTENELRFILQDSAGNPLPINEWGRHTILTERGTGSVGHLLGLLNDNSAHSIDDIAIAVPFEHAAGFGSHQLAALGLPEVAPYTLRLDGSSPLITTPGFTFQYSWISRATRLPDLSIITDGMFLLKGQNRYTLLSPFYELIERIDKFKELPPNDLNARTIAWAEIKELLPEDAIIPNSLQNMNIMRADVFTLDFSDDQQLQPVLLSNKTHAGRPADHNGDISEDTERNWTPLPPLTQDQFAKHFQRTEVQPRYALPNGNWYVVVPPSLTKALKVVKQYQSKPIGQRLSMLHNPIGILKEELGGELEDREIEALFEELPLFTSKRVTGLGEWHPKTGVYVFRTATTEWIPPEEMLLNIPFDNAVVSVQIKNIPDLHSHIQAALDSNIPTIEYNGASIPATEENLASINRIIGANPKANGDTSPTTAESRKKLVPQIIDNIETAGYTGTGKTAANDAFIPTILQSQLFPHQKDGLHWLQRHWNAQRDYESGALLADDMGLGKTLQALAFLAWLHELQQKNKIARKPFLIVAPTGLLKNWSDEAKNHLQAPGFGPPFEAFGSRLKTLREKSSHEQAQTLERETWVLTTYETLRDRIQLFMGVAWNAVVFDEAQKIKNPTSRMTEMAKSLDAEFTLAMTGTPIENTLSDLWSIFDTTNPGLLGAYKEFKKLYEVEQNPDNGANLRLKSVIMDEGETRDGFPYMLRRMKEDHLNGLPEKIITPLREEMPPAQAQRYGEVVAGIQAGQGAQMIIALHAMRKISLLANPLSPEGLTQQDIDSSARLKGMFNVLDQIHQHGEKALIFLEYLDLQDALIPFIQERYGMHHPPAKISGNVSGSKRKELVDIFQERPTLEFDAMILSPKAGGVGLTLTAANHVIHLTRWWNPAVEDQCTDRVYRIGQKKTVHVYLPMAIHPQAGDHSFDHNLHAYLDKKRRLSQEVLAPVAASEEDIEDLYTKSIAKW